MFGSRVHWDWRGRQNKREIHGGTVDSLLDIFDQAGSGCSLFFLGGVFLFFLSRKTCTALCCKVLALP